MSLTTFLLLSVNWFCSFLEKNKVFQKCVKNISDSSKEKEEI